MRDRGVRLWHALLAALFALLSAASSSAAAEEEGRPSRPSGMVARALEALVDQLRGASSPSSRKALVTLLSASATKPSSAALLWDLGLLDVLYAQLRIASEPSSEASEAEAGVARAVVHCLRQVVVQATQSAAPHGQWTPRTLSVAQLRQWSYALTALVRSASVSRDQPLVHDVAAIVDQLVENAQDSLSPDALESVDVAANTRLILDVMDALVDCDLLAPAPRPSAAAATASDDGHHGDGTVTTTTSISALLAPSSEALESRLFTLRSLANITSQSELSAAMVADTAVLPTLLRYAVSSDVDCTSSWR